ncbi:hypothetical protein FRC09_008169 [Ceratobasidium sp. 395]|nr:hypothetical protein FRC09_008169 [Ceratobasidium sp. 395]
MAAATTSDTTIEDVLIAAFAVLTSKVTVIARGNYEKVSAKGIDIKSKKHGDIPGWKPDRVVRSVEEAADRQYKYVLVTTKALPDINPTPQIVAPLLASGYASKYTSPTFVILQNGLGVERDLYEAVRSAWSASEPRILSAAVYIQANLVGGRDVVEQGPFDRLVCGAYRPKLENTDDPQNTFEENQQLEAFAGLIRTGNGDIEIVPDIQRKKFAKNLWNLSFAAFATLVRQPCPAFFWEESQAKIRPTLTKILQEAISVARASGYSEEAVPSSLVEQTIEDTGSLHRPGKPSTHKPSMLVDIETKRPLEVEAIFGEVVRVGRERGLNIPILETIYALLQVTQAGLVKGVY